MRDTNEIFEALDKAGAAYSDSPYTTNAGHILRVVAKLIPLSTVIKLFSHKITNK